MQGVRRGVRAVSDYAGSCFDAQTRMNYKACFCQVVYSTFMVS